MVPSRAPKESASCGRICGSPDSPLMISSDLEHALKAPGKLGVPGVPELLADRERAWRLLMCGHEPWQSLGAKLSTVDLQNVIKGLVLFSQASGWSGGSVSPIIPLYGEYLSRQPIDEPQFTSWIVGHRRNEYEPFGTIVHGGARTLAEFHGHQLWRAQWRSE